MPFINENNELIITWSIEDVIERANERDIELTQEQAKRVLNLMCDKHDCEIGINWDVIDCWINHVLSEEVI